MLRRRLHAGAAPWHGCRRQPLALAALGACLLAVSLTAKQWHQAAGLRVRPWGLPGGVGGGSQCSPTCTANGNCNREDGRCECPWGFTGPDCSTPLLPACALGPGGAAVHCGQRFPRACACLRQCAALLCPVELPDSESNLSAGCFARRDVWLPPCFELAARDSTGRSNSSDDKGATSMDAGSGEWATNGIYSGGSAGCWRRGCHLIPCLWCSACVPLLGGCC